MSAMRPTRTSSILVLGSPPSSLCRGSGRRRLEYTTCFLAPDARLQVIQEADISDPTRWAKGCRTAPVDCTPAHAQRADYVNQLTVAKKGIASDLRRKHSAGTRSGSLTITLWPEAQITGIRRYLGYGSAYTRLIDEGQSKRAGAQSLGTVGIIPLAPRRGVGQS
jgi:hypothetical protein